MPLLIDGYNLLQASTIIGSGGRTSLEASRNALLNYLSSIVPNHELSQTTIVFDGRDAPPGLPKQMRYGDITVRFAPRHLEADDIIEELIEAHAAPRTLTVVSSDHRIQRAARRRRCRTTDSDIWLQELKQDRRHQTQSPQKGFDPKQDVSQLEDDQEWIETFSDESLTQIMNEVDREFPSQAGPSNSPDAPSSSTSPSKRRAPPAKGDELPEDLHNPFPPGYAEDLLDDDD